MDTDPKADIHILVYSVLSQTSELHDCRSESAAYLEVID